MSHRSLVSQFTRRGSLGAALAVSLAGLTPAVARDRVVVGQTFLTPGLDPAKGSAGWALVSHGIAENLFTVGRDGRVTPLLAESAHRRDARTWDIALKPGRFFSDGAPVTAAAVADSLNRTGAENPQARASVGRITFAATGDLTLSATGERDAPVLPSVLAEWAFPVYRLTDAGPIFTGPWAVAGFSADKELKLEPNRHYAGAEARPDVLLRRFADAQSLALAVQSGEVDLGFNLPVEALPQLKRAEGVTVKPFGVGYQYMMWMNTAKPALADVRVRQALDLAVDRDLLAAAVNGGRPATGAFSTDYPFALEEPRPFDRAKAAALLDAAGWRLDGAVRRKDGKALTLDILAYPQRPDLVTFQPVLKAEFAKLGITVTTRVADNISAATKDGDYDLALWAQHTAPAGDPAFFLNLFLRSGATNNVSRYASPALDAILDRFNATSDAEARVAIAHDAERQIFADAPVAYLLAPVWYVGLSPKLKRYEPWGSDYYILRPDLSVAK
jgi:peptide/nickel transport system substrate-binding protein